MKRLIKDIEQNFFLDNVAVHCHDTYGQAIGNIWTSLEVLEIDLETRF